MADRGVLPEGYRRRHFETLASTNGAAMDLLRNGDPGEIWITADRQTGGRGRRGRHWVSEPGNLYCSLAMIDPAPVARLGELPLVAAVALAEALESACSADGRIALKWPNDLLVDGAKISGILAESQPLPDGRQAVVLGIGVNVNHHPEIPDYPVTSLAALDWTRDVEDVFGHLAHEIVDYRGRWNGGEGFAAIRDAWLARAWRLGEEVTVRLGEGTRRGRFLTLDTEGRIVLEAADGNRDALAAGDVLVPGGHDAAMDRNI